MTTQNSCPQCGAEATLSTEEAKSAIPFGEVTWQQSVLGCASCGHEEPLETDDSVLADAIERARTESVQKMLASLKEQGLSMAHLERALGLAPRTAHHWKNGTFSAGTLALLRLVTTYPWLIELARLDFDPEVADSALVQAAETLLTKHGLTIEIKQSAPPTQTSNVVWLRSPESVRPVDDPNAPKVRIS